MKIREFLDQNREALPTELAELLENEHSVWSNDACYGYCIEAMRNAGYGRDEIGKLLPYLHSAFEDYSVEDAETIWHNF